MYDALLIQLEKNRVPVNGNQSYVFDFGPKELLNMVGFSKGDGALVMRKMLENPKIKIQNDKIMVAVISEITKQTEYYRKMQKIEKARQESANWA
jgi:hypothetical protein